MRSMAELDVARPAKISTPPTASMSSDTQPMQEIIGAAIDAIGSAGEDEIRIARVHEDGKRFDLAQRMFPVGAVSGAGKHAGETAFVFRKFNECVPDPRTGGAEPAVAIV